MSNLLKVFNESKKFEVRNDLAERKKYVYKSPRGYYIFEVLNWVLNLEGRGAYSRWENILNGGNFN